MAEPEVIAKVGPKGEVIVEVEGAKGKSCVDLTKDLEEALGSVESRKKKTDYWKQNIVGTSRTKRS